MKVNKIIIISSIVILLLIIATTIKIIKDHNDKLIDVVEKEIKSAAIQCYYESKCNEKITLRELYQLKYLEDEVSDPITKEIYNQESYVEKKDDKFIFVVVDN